MNYRNAKYINDNGWIDCDIQHPVHGWGPYTLDPNDVDMIARNNNVVLLSAMAANGDVESYVPPTQSDLDATLSAELRSQRDVLLSGVDAIASNALRWAALDAAAQDAWAVYRQGLLDVPQQAGFPINVNWPAKPSE